MSIARSFTLLRRANRLPAVRKLSGEEWKKPLFCGKNPYLPVAPPRAFSTEADVKINMRYEAGREPVVTYSGSWPPEKIEEFLRDCGYRNISPAAATPTATPINTPTVTIPTVTPINTPTVTIPTATPTNTPTATIPTATPTDTGLGRWENWYLISEMISFIIDLLPKGGEQNGDDDFLC